VEIQLDNIWGFAWGMHRARLSHNSTSRSTFSDDHLTKPDLELARKLVLAGPSHSKFMRCIDVWATIKAPRYWWQEYATYKIGTTELSESTMHTLTNRPLTSEDFEGNIPYIMLELLNNYIATGKLLEVKRILPESFLQTRGVHLNYQTLRTMYHQRVTHRLPEWHIFCNWVATLPYAELITLRSNTWNQPS